MTESIRYSTSGGQVYYRQQPVHATLSTRKQSFPPQKILPPINFKGDPIAAAQHLKETLFPDTRNRQPRSMQVYIFTMPNHFLILLSPGQLPFTPYTHTGDGLYQVNPLYYRPFFTYPISQQFYNLLCNQHAGLAGVPSLVTFKGSWNNSQFSQEHCSGTIPQLIIRNTQTKRTPFFSMRLIENTWTSSDTLQGVAYSLDGKAFRLWFHEKNPKALDNAIGEKKSVIIETFYPQAASDLDINNVTFELFPQGSETHNRGKVPIKCTFYSDQVELFSIFFKPRDARIDAEVIEVFRKLNALPMEEKSLKVDLPGYKITNADHQGQPYSLWEFIEGQQIRGQTAREVVQTLQNMPEKERLNNQLLRLESICKFLNISDLHLENIIFSHMGEENSQIIPIDLESIQPGNSTGLFENDPETPSFSENEKQLLEACRQAIGEVPARFVPIPTSHF